MVCRVKDKDYSGDLIDNGSHNVIQPFSRFGVVYSGSKELMNKQLTKWQLPPANVSLSKACLLTCSLTLGKFLGPPLQCKTVRGTHISTKWSLNE